MYKSRSHWLIYTIARGGEKMEFKVESRDPVEQLLVSAAHEGDFTALKQCLDTVPNPDDYIDRQFCEGPLTKYSIVMIACLHGHEDFLREFLHHYKPDLEVLSSVFGNDIPIARILFALAPALWVAAGLNNLAIVKLLVEHGAQVNHVAGRDSTALSFACAHGNLDMVRYLVEKGGDIRIADVDNDTNLVVSICHRHLNVVTYLVDEAGFDVNECDEDGCSPLYIAVIFSSSEITQLLLDRGARDSPSTGGQMSALMWAAETLQTDIFDAILPHCSVLERIEGTELFASALICFGLDGDELERAFEYLGRALDLRAQYDLPKVLRPASMRILDGRQECETIDQLQMKRSSRDDMWMEAMLVRERLLGPTNARFNHSIRQFGAVLTDRGDCHQAVALWLYKVEVSRYYGISVDTSIAGSITDIFSRMLTFGSCPSIDALATTIAITLENLDVESEDFDFGLYTLLVLIPFACLTFRYPDISPPDRSKIHRQLHEIIQRNLVTRNGGFSLLHLSLMGHSFRLDNDTGILYR